MATKKVSPEVQALISAQEELCTRLGQANNELVKAQDRIRELEVAVMNMRPWAVRIQQRLRKLESKPAVHRSSREEPNPRSLRG